MNHHTYRRLVKALSVVINLLIIISMVGQALLPVVAYAAVPEPPEPTNYATNLLAVSDILRLDDDGNLYFPHPEQRPGVAKGVVIPAYRNQLLPLGASFDHPLLPVDLPMISGQSNRVDNQTQFALPMLPNSVKVNSPPSLLPLQTKSTTRTVFLPVVMSGQEAPSVVSTKAIFALLLPQAKILASELGFSADQIAIVQQVIDSELVALSKLEQEANNALAAPTLTLQGKRSIINGMAYNERLQVILEESQQRLQTELGNRPYKALKNWLESEWQLFVAERNAVRSTLTARQTTTETETCQMFDVFATRSTYTDISADLPDKFVKFANLGVQYVEGYTSSTVYSITVKYNAQVIPNVVVKDIVWNHNDNYWNTVTDTVHPRRMFTDLPQGMPEAEAAYFDGYNGGKNEFGQLVTNPAGLNISQQVAAQLNIGGSAWVEVTFPWGCISEERPPETRLEQSWGVNEWSASVAHLVNPVTGNFGNWFRDLHLPAPGIELDFVRYYNSQDGSDGIFGRGWSSQFDMRVYPQADGSYKVRFEDGRRGFFRPDGQGGFVGDAGAYETFAIVGSGYVVTTTDQIVHNFDSTGRLQTISDLVGNQITLVYSGNNPTKIIDSVGREVTLAYNGNGYVTQLTDTAGRVVTYNYSPMARSRAVWGLDSRQSRQSTASASLLSVTDPNGGTTTYQYDPTTLSLSEAVDPDGIAFVKNSYDSLGRVLTQVNAAGELVTFDYDGDTATKGRSAGNRTTSTDKLGNKTTYVYDSKFRLVEEIDALGHSTRYKYDNRDNMIEKTDNRGNSWRYEYDDRGNMTKRIDPIDQYSKAYYNSDITTWEYNSRNQQTKMTNALGEVTRYEYDDKGNLTKVIEANGATTISEFNSKGQMTRMVDAEGRETKFDYDQYGNRNKITDPLGHVTLIKYNAAGHVLERTDPNGYTTKYEYDGNGNVTKITDPMGRETRMTYNGSNKVTKQTDRRGAVTELKYDDDLNLIEVKDPLGNVVKFEYDKMGNRTKLIDAKGGVTTYKYDALYRIVEQTDPAGNITKYEYDENDNLVKAIDPMGGVTRMVYDALNRRKFVYDALGHQTEYCYDQLDRPTRMFDPLRAMTRFVYDNVGNLVEQIDPLGAVTKMEYGLVRNPVATIDPMGNKSTTEYDKLNRPIVQTDPLGHKFRTEYDKVGNVVKTIDPKGNENAYTYNQNYWLVKTTNALGDSAEMVYDEEGNLLESKDEAGNSTKAEYDLLGRPTKTTDALGHTSQVKYDANGNQTEVTDANGKVTKTEYDSLNIPIKTIDSLGNETRYEYDALQRLTKTIDANGKETSYAYNAVSQLIKTTNALGESYEYGYDAAGNNTVVTDSNRIATYFGYNFLNQLVKETNPLSMTWEYHYDLNGNMVMKVDGKWQAIHYEYDEANQLVRTRYPDGKTINYAYDDNGNQIKMADWNGEFVETFDALNRRVSSTDYKGRQLQYSYDKVSNSTELVYPNGYKVNYDYNARYELESMTDPAGLVTRYSYDAVGLLTSQERPNNTRTDISYDDAYRVTNFSNTKSSGEVMAQFAFDLDPVGNRTHLIETRHGASPVTYDFTYDDIYQLIQVESSDGQSLSYDYDPVGNRAEIAGVPKSSPTITSTPAVSTSYEYNDLNSMLQAGNSQFIQDDNGNRVQVTQPLSETQYASSGFSGTLITDYSFDVSNRIVMARETLSYYMTISGSVVYSQAVVMEADYSYDGMGRRMAKLVQKYDVQGNQREALLREYVYNGLDVVAEYEYINGATEPQVNHYYYANGEKVSMESMPHSGSARTYWYTYDALGTTAAMADANGLIVAEYHHDEYGRLVVGDSLLNRYLFTGQEFDPETGLIHFFARYYDSNTGVWLSQDVERGDPMHIGTWNRYAYVLNNPINMVDELGYWPSFVDKAVNKGKKAFKKVKKTVENKVIKPATEKIKNAGEYINKKVVQPTVQTFNTTKKWVKKNVVQPVKKKVKKVAKQVNENYIQPAIEKTKEVVQSTREAVTKAADWIQENRTAVMAGVGFVVGVAAGVAAASLFCVGTAGLGCAVMAGAAAGLVAGGLAAGGLQMGANVLDSDPDSGLFDNVGSSMAIGGIAGGIGGALGGGATYFMSGGSSAGNMASNACRFNSFAEGTLVSTANGLLPIEDVELGDELLAYDENSDETGYKPVSFVTSHIAHTLIALTVATSTILATPNHPIWVEGDGWVDAETIEVGDALRQADGDFVTVVATETVEQTTEVFNFTVDETHTYFVTEGEYLVHNCRSPQQMGRIKEAQTLVRNGLTKYKGKSIGGNPVKTIPDALTKNALHEMKYVKYLSRSNQLRAQMNYASRKGLEYVLHVKPGNATKISAPLRQDIIRMGGRIVKDMF